MALNSFVQCCDVEFDDTMGTVFAFFEDAVKVVVQVRHGCCQDGRSLSRSSSYMTPAEIPWAMLIGAR